MTAEFTCTHCFRESGNAPDIKGMSLETIIALCKKWRCDECLDILEAERSSNPSPETQMVATNDPIAWAEFYDGKIVTVQLDKSKWHTTPLYLSAPADQMMVTSAPEILSRIAEVADAVGFQAGEPAMELAGQIVSVLAGHPEHIDRFMGQGTELFLDGTFGIENGTLTYRAINGQIPSPSVIREKNGTQQ